MYIKKKKNLCLGVAQTYFPSVKTLAAIRIRRNILRKLLVQLSNVSGFISAFNHPQRLGLPHMFGHPLITEELTAKSCWGFLFGSLDFFFKYIHFMYQKEEL